MSAVVEYEVVTPAGTPVFTTPELDLARAYLRERAKREPDLLLRLEEVATVRRTIEHELCCELCGAPSEPPVCVRCLEHHLQTRMEEKP